MAKTKNEYIKKAKKKRFIKRIIIISILLLICGGSIVTYTDIFKIEKVICTGENLVTGDYVLEKSESLKGENILFLNKKDFEKILKENPYVKNIVINKKYPSTLEIEIVEKKGLYYVKQGEEYNIISSDMIYVEKTNSIEGRKLIELTGVDLSDKVLGDNIGGNIRIEKVLNDMYSVEQFIDENEMNIEIKTLDIADLANIKVYLASIEIYIGNDEDVYSKMIRALGIYETGLAEKYIDISSSLNSSDIQ
ncbi:cell division protein FtsQ/DivIB [Clostridium vincentii]|uniref:Cell division protein FtsQ n=1 Tax=Clostridium vincentii TaxID=52704 RepID=A0A2T0BGE0_9CLOT|nr:FtsQ-type POTRA domain-containing protein [Clostridium vincentii]PRR82928.1 cell division protein FtsQ [Clostridium vincentii]